MMRPVALALLACLVLIAACAPLPRVPYSGQYSGASETAYRRAYQLGFLDGRRGREEDYERYYYEYNQATEHAFERGYDLGFETGEDQAEADESDRDRATNEGYNAGRGDAENGLSPFHQRHRSAYSTATESSFRCGYVKGYNAARRDDSTPPSLPKAE